MLSSPGEDDFLEFLRTFFTVLGVIGERSNCLGSSLGSTFSTQAGRHEYSSIGANTLRKCSRHDSLVSVGSCSVVLSCPSHTERAKLHLFVQKAFSCFRVEFLVDCFFAIHTILLCALTRFKNVSGSSRMFLLASVFFLFSLCRNCSNAVGR